MEYKGVNYGDSERVSDRRFKQRVVPKVGFKVGKVWELHAEISRRILLGGKNTAIAEALNCTPATVSNVRNSPVIQDRLAIMGGARDAHTVDIARDIQEFAPKALELLKQIIEGKGPMTNASPALKAKTAESWLDRAGHGAVKREERLSVSLTKEEIEQLKERAMRANGPVIEAEYSVAKGG